MASTYRNVIEIPQAGALAFRHYFIPHDTNNHHPHAIRPHALKIYAVALITIKLALTGFLYAIYPNEAQFAQLTESKMFELTNTDRQAQGLLALKLNTRLNDAARAKANDMLAKNYFDHTGPDGKKFWQWIKEEQYAYTTAGENLAMDFTTAESANGALMASPSHRANILKPTYTEVGFAVVQGTLLGGKTTVLVEYFGNPIKPVIAAKPAKPQQPTVPTIPVVPSTTVVAGETTPTYTAQLLGTSDEVVTLASGASTDVWVEYKNTGTATWHTDGTDALSLVTTNAADTATLLTTASWATPSQPSRLTGNDVTPNGTVRMTIPIAAATTGSSTLSLQLRTADGTSVDGSVVSLPIHVVVPQPAAIPTPNPTHTAFNTTSVDIVQQSGSEKTVPVATAPALPSNSIQIAHQQDWQKMLVDWTVRFFWAFLFFLTAALLLHVVYAARVQHRRVVVPTLVVIGLATILALTPLHFIERVSHIIVV